ncbi:MAG: hypothetical protein AB1468_01400 [Candidatus Micrarchaeota archaeon]
MTTREVHDEKYKMFKKDAENEANSVPTKIEAYFNASFHLVERNAAKVGVHIQKHQLLRSILEKNPSVFGENTEHVWRAFQELENQIRPGQVYGGSINGKKLKRAKELFSIIESICSSGQNDSK